MTELPLLIRWEKGTFAESAYLGDWYIGALYEVDPTHFVMQCSVPTEDAAHTRTPHSTREGAKAFAEHRVREFLAYAQLPGRI